MPGRVDVTWASPGDPVRIVKVLDVVEPAYQGPRWRWHLPRPGSGRPGAQGRPAETHVLRGAAVVAAGYLPRAQEAVVDMTAPTAALSPLGGTHNLVVEFDPAAGRRLGRRGRAPACAGACWPWPPTWPKPPWTPHPTTRRRSPVARSGRSGGGQTGSRGWAPITNLQTQGTFKDDLRLRAAASTAGLAHAASTRRARRRRRGRAASSAIRRSRTPPACTRTTRWWQALLRPATVSDLDFRRGGAVARARQTPADKELGVGRTPPGCAPTPGFDAADPHQGGRRERRCRRGPEDGRTRGARASPPSACSPRWPDPTAPGLPSSSPPNRATAMVSTGNYDDPPRRCPRWKRALGGAELALLGRARHGRPWSCRPPSSWLPSVPSDGAASPAALRNRHGDDRQGLMARVVHYLNQFFVGAGGEDAAASPPSSQPMAPSALADAWPSCSVTELRDRGHRLLRRRRRRRRPEAVAEILALIQAAKPDLVVTGPAFTSGRYGLACARVAAAATAGRAAGRRAMHPGQPRPRRGRRRTGGAPAARRPGAWGRRSTTPGRRRPSAWLAGEALTAADGRSGTPARPAAHGRRNAARAGGRPGAGPPGRATGTPPRSPSPLRPGDARRPPVADLGAATVALVTEGAPGPRRQPRRASSRPGPPSGCATRSTAWRSSSRASGGRSTAGSPRCGPTPTRTASCPSTWPASSSGRAPSASCTTEYLVTAGNGTSVANARRFGIEWAADLRHSGARAAILTAT
ncbi:MAG: glycine/sarcosine/betaine reductase selenoprotein B family protein [Hymenobacter sp.]